MKSGAESLPMRSRWRRRCRRRNLRVEGGGNKLKHGLQLLDGRFDVQLDRGPFGDHDGLVEEAACCEFHTDAVLSLDELGEAIGRVDRRGLVRAVTLRVNIGPPVGSRNNPEADLFERLRE